MYVNPPAYVAGYIRRSLAEQNSLRSLIKNEMLEWLEHTRDERFEGAIRALKKLRNNDDFGHGLEVVTYELRRAYGKFYEAATTKSAGFKLFEIVVEKVLSSGRPERSIRYIQACTAALCLVACYKEAGDGALVGEYVQKAIKCFKRHAEEDVTQAVYENSWKGVVYSNGMMTRAVAEPDMKKECDEFIKICRELE